MRRRRIRDFRPGYETAQPGQKEKISYAFYHRLAFTTAVTQSLEFFNVAASGAVGNLKAAGQLPNHNYFRTRAVRFSPMIPPRESAAAASAAGVIEGPWEDMFNLLATGIVKFRIGEKDYGQWPAWMLPAGGGIGGVLNGAGTQAAGSTNTWQYAVNGSVDPRQVYTLPVPLVLIPQYNFSLVAEWTALITLTGLSPINITAILDGELMRPVQ